MIQTNAIQLRIAACGIMALGLVGCVATTAPKPVDPVGVKVPTKVSVQTGAVPLPSGVDMFRLNAIDEGKGLRVYSGLVGIGEAKDARADLLFPNTGARKIGTSRQVNQRFVSMINETGRFEVFDDEATGVRDASEIVVEGMIVYAGQRWDRLLGQRKAISTVRLSIQVHDKATGELIPPAIRTLEGVYGENAGEGTLLDDGESPNSRTVADSLASDMDKALEETLRSAAAMLTLRMRPMGKVVAAQDGVVAIFGGERHGVQPKDRVIVFRPTIRTLGDKDVIALTKPIAVVACDSVGVETSQCAVLRQAPGTTIKEGDYAVLSDESTRLRLDQ